MDVNTLKDIGGYIDRAFTGAKPVLGAIVTFAGFVMFPVQFYRTSFLAVFAAAIIDAITKIYSICKKNGGYKNSVKKKKVFSKTLWKGTEVKFVSYLMISVLTGLSYRVVYLEGLGIFIASFVYSVMFMREFQSNIENLIEAGAKLDWLLLFARKKNKELMKPYEEEEKKTPKENEVKDYEERI
ncbi:hypothetical protein [Tissierella sp.]|uniref:hypothetical protein n=1 Tax=Tissierella sp. TaxID=41274 RepID=UPI002865AD60|nr:hypothetical protein [Tissierella sp.]MDR7856076.1 hypothetical protein [Tissierella sp.]